MLATAFAAAIILQQSPMTKQEELAQFHQPVRSNSVADRLQGFELRKKLVSGSPFKNLQFRNVGPEIQGGRIVDIAVPEDLPHTMYIAFATGGLWRTDNNGTTWKSLFDSESSFGIGDIAISGTGGKTIWVGTGESNSSRTSYPGTGVFKSTDGGQSWHNMGLADTHHIGRVLIHPRDSNIVYVAAIGHLYSWNDDRGVYKTVDGGKTWEKVLFINEMTGVIDIVMHPRNPNILYAAAWQRDRRAWNFLESGEGSGIYKTIDGGRRWTKLSGGFPQGATVGRIGLAVCEASPNALFALLDNHTDRIGAGRGDEGAPSGSLTIRRLRMMTEEQLAQVDPAILRRFFSGRFPQLSVEELVEKLKAKTVTIAQILKHLGDANAIMFDREIIGPEVYRSDDAGQTWKRTHEKYLENVYSSYGYYFGQIAVSPQDPKVIYLLAVPILKSVDGGKTFQSIDARGVHVDHHALWIDPRWPDRVALGNDGGLNLSWDGGATWQKVNNLPVGQFTTIEVDNARPYRILGGLQDNGTMRGPSNYRLGARDPWEWEDVGGGDGATVQVDRRNSETMIVSSQFGSAFRRGPDGNWNAQPQSQIEDEPLRYNWVSPFIMSSHHNDIVYYGANKLFRSMDQGRTWTAISDDLTNGVRGGDVPYGTITTVSESPRRFGLIYAGTDDGNVWRTKDGGSSWKKLNVGLAPGKWVTRVVASMHEEGTVYVSQTGYREDDFSPYLFRSTNYGDDWKPISHGLPHEHIYVVREDPSRKNLLYIGANMGVFLSFDAGNSWEALQGGLPHVPVHDIAIQARERELVIGTHGRSVFVLPIRLVQMLTSEIRTKEIHIFDAPAVQYDPMWAYRRPSIWDRGRTAAPMVQLPIWLSEARVVTAVVKDKDGKALIEHKHNDLKPADYGINFVNLPLQTEAAKPIPEEGIDWKPTAIEDILRDPFADKRAKFLQPGEYTIEITAGTAVASTKLVITMPRER